MIRPRTSPKSYRYSVYEGYELRCQRRLQQDLGVDEAAVEAILHMRAQILELQSHIRELEAELRDRDDTLQVLMARHPEEAADATWVEVEIWES